MFGIIVPLGLLEVAAGATVAANYRGTVTLGSVILGVLVAIATLIALVYGVRYKVGWQAASAAADELRKSLDDEKERVERLDEKLEEARELIAGQMSTIKRLEALPNLERIVALMGETAERQDKHAAERLGTAMHEVHGFVHTELSSHEARALERHQELVATVARLEGAVAAVRPAA